MDPVCHPIAVCPEQLYQGMKPCHICAFYAKPSARPGIGSHMWCERAQSQRVTFWFCTDDDTEITLCAPPPALKVKT